jgi:acyl-coenzyme A synthetase/AMP-(fatty) acid ligase
VPVDALDPLYILYTSGTTGKPKGIIRDNGGHAVALKYSMHYVYGTEPGEVYWAASDVGWVVGHSYIVYGPLINGSTTILYEGKPVKTPDPGAFWRVIAEHGVKTLFTAPTAIRAIKREDDKGEFFKQYDLSHFRRLYLAGERLDEATYYWAKGLLGEERDVIDNWWQTESGWPMLAQMPGYGMIPVKPGSATRPVCGYDIQIMSPDNRVLGPDEEGAVCVRLPLPPGCFPTLWNNDDRFRSSYLDPYPGYYYSGDGGHRDADGYVFITGRMDDVINVAGHRLSTSDMEEIVAKHPAVAECAVIGIHDRLKGQVPVGFVVLKDGIGISEEQIRKELIQMVRAQIGAVAAFRQATILRRLPKTRSGKILRRVMRAIADGETYATPSTIEDPNVLSEITEEMKNHGIGEAFSV